jgi:hypothetical protein
MTNESDQMAFISPGQFPSAPATPGRPVAPRTGTVFTVFLVLKAAQFAVYVFGWIFIPSTILQWVLTIVASAADFWFTKNVAGRLILGMRWSSGVTEDGESQWVFEFVPGGIAERVAQRRTFWVLIAATVGLWSLFSFFSLVRLSLGWLFVAGIGLSLACSNAWGFWKCDKSTGQDLNNSAPDRIQKELVPFVLQKGGEFLGARVGLLGALRPEAQL